MSAECSTRRSAGLSGQTQGSTRQDPFRYLDEIPMEIRLKILESILISPDRLSFTRTPLLPSSSDDLEEPFLGISRVLRLCRLEETRTNEPVALALHTDFKNISLVSKQMREEASTVFFACNKWVLHVHTGMNSIDWMIEKWGPESLRRIRVMRIFFQVTCCQGEWEIFKSLERFVDVVKEGAQLRTFSVYLDHVYKGKRRARYIDHIPHVPWTGRPRQFVRKSTRARDISHTSEERYNRTDFAHRPFVGDRAMTRAAREVILTPLQELRQVETSIEGYLTESWALWLEDCMRADKGVIVDAFDMAPDARRTLHNLKEAKNLNEYFWTAAWEDIGQ